MATVLQVHRGREDRPAIVFVHGLGGNAVTTWQDWPMWVGEDTGFDTWVVGYEAALSAWLEEALPLNRQADQIADLLASCRGLAGKPLILVGHSMGGLLIKAMMLQGSRKGVAHIERLVERVAAVVFVATPHSGAGLANFAQALGPIIKTNSQVKSLELHDSNLSELNAQFRQLVAERKLAIQVYAEGKDVAIYKKLLIRVRFGGVRVVNPTSSDPGLPNVTPTFLEEDHISIAKPRSRSDQIHVSLLAFVERVVGEPNVGASVTLRSTEQEAKKERPRIKSESHPFRFGPRTVLTILALAGILLIYWVEGQKYCVMARFNEGKEFTDYNEVRSSRRAAQKRDEKERAELHLNPKLIELRLSCSKWPNVLHEMGVAKYFAAHLREAQSDLRAALKYFPSEEIEGRARNGLISVLIAGGDLRAAESEAELQYKKREPGGAIYNLPLIKMKLEKYPEADELFAGVLARRDTGAEGRAFANFGRATVAVLNKNAAAAVKFASAAICDFPGLSKLAEEKGKVNLGEAYFEAFWVTLQSVADSEAYNALNDNLRKERSCE